MASGPMLTGLMLLVLPTAWQSATLLVPALVIMIATGIFLVGRTSKLPVYPHPCLCIIPLACSRHHGGCHPRLNGSE